MTENNQLSPEELAKMGWIRERKRYYTREDHSLQYVYLIKRWVLYSPDDVALFNFATLKSGVEWYEMHRDTIRRNAA